MNKYPRPFNKNWNAKILECILSINDNQVFTSILEFKVFQLFSSQIKQLLKNAYWTSHWIFPFIIACLEESQSRCHEDMQTSLAHVVFIHTVQSTPIWLKLIYTIWFCPPLYRNVIRKWKNNHLRLLELSFVDNFFSGTNWKY